MISRIQLSALILIAALVWGLVLIAEGVQVTPAWFRPFSIVIGILVTLLTAVDRWLWRWRWLQLGLFPMPDIRGTWLVRLRPEAPWNNPPERQAYMVIRQTYSSVTLRFYTAESASESITARVMRAEDGTFSLAAVYRNTPRLPFRKDSPIHLGALKLDIQGDPPTALSGQYWTDRKSQGELLLSDRKWHLASSFEDGAKMTGEVITEKESITNV